VYHDNNQLFEFGGDVLFIKNNCNTNDSRYWPGYNGNYELPEGMDKDSEESKCYLAGSKEFKVLELEVYAIE
jgi:hypothetical protein